VISGISPAKQWRLFGSGSPETVRNGPEQTDFGHRCGHGFGWVERALVDALVARRLGDVVGVRRALLRALQALE
jgi:hypothetical protein